MVNEDADQRTLLRKYERELRKLRAELTRRNKELVDKRHLLEVRACLCRVCLLLFVVGCPAGLGRLRSIAAAPRALAQLQQQRWLPPGTVPCAAVRITPTTAGSIVLAVPP